MRDQGFNFVGFCNIRDNVKMVQALNKLCFGSYTVLTNISRFNRHDGRKDHKKIDVE